MNKYRGVFVTFEYNNKWYSLSSKTYETIKSSTEDSLAEYLLSPDETIRLTAEKTLKDRQSAQ
jgi:lipocalin